MAFRAPAQRLLRNPAAHAAQARQLAAAASPTLATLPDLPYDYDALAPVIIPEIMILHHSKHHQTYVNAFNKALEELDAAEAAGDAAKIVSLQGALKFNGGGALAVCVAPARCRGSPRAPTTAAGARPGPRVRSRPSSRSRPALASRRSPASRVSGPPQAT